MKLTRRTAIDEAEYMIQNSNLDAIPISREALIKLVAVVKFSAHPALFSGGYPDDMLAYARKDLRNTLAMAGVKV